jgi:DNA-binding Xre family transcriptional regulator
MLLSHRKIESVMADRGFSATALCRASGVSKPWWSGKLGVIKRGGNIRPLTAKRIADILGVKPSEIEEPEPNPTTETRS